jgi:hypothetical protein
MNLPAPVTPACACRQPAMNLPAPVTAACRAASRRCPVMDARLHHQRANGE